jgi:hypothetical protein
MTQAQKAKRHIYGGGTENDHKDYLLREAVNYIAPMNGKDGFAMFADGSGLVIRRQFNMLSYIVA